ncbi:hypothetical protein BD310DRAFT_919131 [Dichomitus squalens]|uniref:Uncharacterized protein n=1 Tax=Dichomitus squalens TaxID=114155 RepID=A0A4Q9Q4L9_9APHY|nr:hypothetical protein BD310DRAFT_919131 [Dichomitus squalens]
MTESCVKAANPTVEYVDVVSPRTCLPAVPVVHIHTPVKVPFPFPVTVPADIRRQRRAVVLVHGTVHRAVHQDVMYAFGRIRTAPLARPSYDDAASGMSNKTRRLPDTPLFSTCLFRAHLTVLCEKPALLLRPGECPSTPPHTRYATTRHGLPH